jgi:hypothetical protein
MINRSGSLKSTLDSAEILQLPDMGELGCASRKPYPGDARVSVVRKRPMVAFQTQLLLVIWSRFARRGWLEAENLVLRNSW